MTPEQYLATGDTLKWLLAIAWLLPLAGFAVEIFAGYWSTRVSKAAAWLAVGCIATGFVCSSAALITWGNATHWSALASATEEHAEHDAESETAPDAPAGEAAHGHDHAHAAGDAAHAHAADGHAEAEHSHEH